MVIEVCGPFKGTFIYKFRPRCCMTSESAPLIGEVKVPEPAKLRVGKTERVSVRLSPFQVEFLKTVHFNRSKAIEVLIDNERKRREPK
jgi:hypothetical protein